MSLLTNKFQLVTKDPQPGALAGIWEMLEPEEVSAAKAVGSGPGVPDLTGTTQLGTILPGRIMEINPSGHFEDGNSPNLGSAFQKMFWIVFEGTTDYSSAEAGKITAVHGGSRIETTEFVAGPAYIPGLPLIVVAGQLQPKAAAADGIQAVGFVGPSGVNTDGVLDAYLLQGM
jgi:hypothetical protein